MLRLTLHIRTLGVLLTVAVASLIAPAATHAADTTYYVDAVSGNDANSGTSTGSAWRTLSAVNARTFGPGDRILLKAGGIWNDQYLDLRGSGSASSPIIVDKYGTGAKPVINFGNTGVNWEGFGVRLKNVSYWEVNNLEITGGQHATDRRRSGVLVVGEGSGAGDFHHIHIKNIDVHDVFGTDRRTGGINFHARSVGTSPQPESTWTDVLIEGNTVVNVADTGIQTMTDAFFDTTWQHQTDAFKNVVIRNNYLEQIHRDGILVRAAVNPLVEYNTTNKVGLHTSHDPAVVNYLDSVVVVAAQWPYSVTGAVFQYNEAFDTRRINGDGQAWDFDRMVYNSVYQYNYSHHNDGGALLIMDTTDENTFRYNISEDDLDQSNGVFAFSGTAGDTYIYNNVIYRSMGQTGPLTRSPTNGAKAYYKNNIFYNGASGGYTTDPGAVYTHNLFYGANSGQPADPNKLTANPLFVAPGGGTAASYKLQPGSPAINSGTAIINDNGGKDFFGTGLYQGAPDRGVHESVEVFRDDFEDGDANGWTTVGGTWSVLADGSQVYAQSATSGEFISRPGITSWTDYTVRARVKIGSTSGNAGVLFRYTDASNFYTLRAVDGMDRLELYKKVGGTLTLLASVPVPVVANQFHTLQVTVAGNHVRGWFDGAPLINWTNPTTQLTSGGIGLRSHSSTARYDDVLVTR